MPDREKYIDVLKQIVKAKEKYYAKEDDMPIRISYQCVKDILELLKEQDERYVSMVVSWLREIAINNVDSNREMTFLDVVEDIRDRASYGLKQYFIDKQEGR